MSRTPEQQKAMDRDIDPVIAHSKLLNREQARKEGQSLYKGRPCKYGHVGWRYVKNWGCYHCSRRRAQSVRSKKYQNENEAGDKRKQIERRLEDLALEREIKNETW